MASEASKLGQLALEDPATENGNLFVRGRAGIDIPFDSNDAQKDVLVLIKS